MAVATADDGVLEVCIEMGGDSAKGEDGPLPLESQLHASQSVQVLVKAGERLAFKAYPIAKNAQVLKTIVWAADFKSEHEVEAARASQERAAAKPEGAPTTH